MPIRGWQGQSRGASYEQGKRQDISKEDRTVIRTLMEDLTPPFQTRQRIGRMRDNVGLNDDVDNAINPAINHRAETI